MNKQKNDWEQRSATTTIHGSMNTMGKSVSSMKMAAKKMQHGLLTALLLLIIVPVGEGVWLDVPTTGTKCVSEEIQSNVVVLADYIIISEDDSLLPTISVKVNCLRCLSWVIILSLVQWFESAFCYLIHTQNCLKETTRPVLILDPSFLIWTFVIMMLSFFIAIIILFYVN